MISSLKQTTKKLILSSSASYTATLGPMQKIVMLCGAPGVGKGMYSRFLADDFGYVQVSTGDEIRKILHGTSAKNKDLNPVLVNKLRQYVNAGKLVPDQVVMELLYQKINEPGSARGVILDGFPRTVNQLNLFNQVYPIHLVINIRESYDYIMASILGRRTCMSCGMSYSAFSYFKDGYELDVQMPAVEGVCDKCGGKVETREDDNEETVKARLLEYEKKTFPLLDRLEKDGLLIPFEPKRGERDYPMLQQMIISHLGLPYYFFQQHNKDFNLTTYHN